MQVVAAARVRVRPMRVAAAPTDNGRMICEESEPRLMAGVLLLRERSLWRRHSKFGALLGSDRHVATFQSSSGFLKCYSLVQLTVSAWLPVTTG